MYHTSHHITRKETFNFRLREKGLYRNFYFATKKIILYKF